ncbi:1-acyl-sn-glycerol-3-phosphate acyltransferase [Parendozoicomonas haliclonae]|uniref:Acyltransferase n=1 Tax=Parendozoicomonas haliclonae TaxID=1960125 RepID=A0A1X7AQZ8_9GAMM|nr:1-acyl-sn-glycerol-3-phosphate acyltransferase [Parendozoicomonas haliclonae]SMA50552.1 Acyltransferase [Parendozoicomonas haliclonae]
MESFDDIRPYHDAEVAPVLHELVRNKQLLNAVGHFQFGEMPEFARNLMRPLVERKLRKLVAGVDNVHALQQSIKSMLEKVIDRTTDELTWSGIEHLPKDKPCLLLSNHRDIVMDPALVNYVLHETGRNTARIAIGDNLLSRPYISDLMRLNKSFIVRRSITGRREKLQALLQLSAYIRHSLGEQENVWIAQREGRAKDGNDRTDTAILKMLHMGFRADQLSFSDMLNHLNIVPVSISYEYDPCDVAKARELVARTTNGSYNKEENEDLNSIVTGIEGFKGRVHVAFGTPINPELETPVTVAEEIDRQMHSLYRLWPSNWLARDILEGREQHDGWRDQFDGADLAKQEALFRERLEQCPEEARSWFLKIYANPVFNQQVVV